MNAKCIGEISFLAGLFLFFFFLFFHCRKRKFVKRKDGPGTGLFEEGTFAVLKFVRERGFYRIKRERLEHLRKIYVGEEEENIYYKHYGNIVKKMAVVMTAGLFLVSFSVFIKQEPFLFRDYFLPREGTDGAAKKYSIRAKSGKKEKKITVKIPNRVYSSEEETQVLKEVKEKLNSVVLGENEAAEKISKPLNFVKSFSEYEVSIRWKVPLNSPVSTDGTLKNKNIGEPVPVILKAVIACGDRETIWTKEVVIYPSEEKKKLSFWEKWQKEYEKAEKKSRSEKYVKLPEKIEGKKITYSRDQLSYPHLFLAFVFFLCLLLPVLAESQLKGKVQKRQEQLSMDYPEFIEHFVLLIGAGMTVTGAWRKIVDEYEKRKEKEEVHFVYEEMKVTVMEVKNGMSERKAYELFGKRTGLLPYMKFCTLLVQNLQKGSSDLLNLLEYEMMDSFQARKENAKALGEKAGTKLLLPMAVMLLIVFVLILYAAFQNM